jgi:membrane protease YdiL (CAAX protease family)
MKRPPIEVGFLLIALIWPATAAWLYFVAADPSNHAVPSLYSAGKVLQFALPLLCWILTERTRFHISSPRLRDLGGGIAFGVAVFAAILMFYFAIVKSSAFLSGLDVQVRTKVIAMGLDSKTRYIFFVLFLSLFHSGLEEYYWRAFVFAGLRKHLPLPLAIAISSLGFMGHHVLVLSGFFPGRFWSATIPFSLAIAVGGAVWAYQYHRTRSIYPVWCGHALVDLAILTVGFDLVFSTHIF